MCMGKTRPSTPWKRTSQNGSALKAAVFVASGTQSNLCALLSHCGRGDEFIAGHHAHTYLFEGGGAAALGGIQPQPLPFAADGTVALDAIRAAIKPDDDHFARTRLLCLENTQAGKPLPLSYLHRALWLASDESTFVTGQAHVVDGGATLGRAWNAQPAWMRRQRPITVYRPPGR